MMSRSRMSDETQLNAAFAALADPSRRRILALLRETPELRVSDVAACFEMSLNGVSKHLKVLEKAGLVDRRVDGRTHWLSASWAGLQPAYEFLHFYNHFWNARVDALVDYLKEET